MDGMRVLFSPATTVLPCSTYGLCSELCMHLICRIHACIADVDVPIMSRASAPCWRYYLGFLIDPKGIIWHAFRGTWQLARRYRSFRGPFVSPLDPDPQPLSCPVRPLGRLRCDLACACMHARRAARVLGPCMHVFSWPLSSACRRRRGRPPRPLARAAATICAAGGRPPGRRRTGRAAGAVTPDLTGIPARDCCLYTEARQAEVDLGSAVANPTALARCSTSPPPRVES